MEFNYDNILQMLVSPDIENRNVAMMALENLEFDEYKLRILFLKREANIDIGVWGTVTPELSKKMRRVLNEAGESIDKPLTNASLIEVLRYTPATDEDYLFSLNRMFTHFITRYASSSVNSSKLKNIKLIRTDD